MAAAGGLTRPIRMRVGHTGTKCIYRCTNDDQRVPPARPFCIHLACPGAPRVSPTAMHTSTSISAEFTSGVRGMILKNRSI